MMTPAMGNPSWSWRKPPPMGPKKALAGKNHHDINYVNGKMMHMVMMVCKT